ncbi:hypothetical protein NPIL_509341 [Nephila pilipes]|uniref:Uncharacterized protein n=1 Tax=Nephila pilipes TaxID=299642 RepID=A0A8X6N577_NEPPI|nr:hypothetical protein NPIL_509341 [Nephila pilipes]
MLPRVSKRRERGGIASVRLANRGRAHFEKGRHQRNVSPNKSVGRKKYIKCRVRFPECSHFLGFLTSFTFWRNVNMSQGWQGCDF